MLEYFLNVGTCLREVPECICMISWSCLREIVHYVSYEILNCVCVKSEVCLS